MVVEAEAAVPKVINDDVVVAQLFKKVLIEEMGLNSTLVQIPGDDTYEENRKKHFNLDMISCHPLLFVTPTTTQEVSLVVPGYTQGLQRWKEREQQETNNDGASLPLPKLCICGGRHSTRSFVENSFVVDMSKMDQVTVDPKAHTVTVQGGVKIQKLMDTLAPYHLSPVTGTHSDTGVIGLTLGGGQGFLSKKYGPAIDQILNVEIVLADGSIHTISIDDKTKFAQDIMFNIRGGGGNIGILTSLTMKVYPIHNLALMEKVNFVFTQNGVQDVLVRYGQWSLSCGDDCTSFCILPLGTIAPVVVVAGVSSNTDVIPQGDVSAEEATTRVNYKDIPGFNDLNNNIVGSWFHLPGKFKVKDYHTELLQELSKEDPDYYYYTNIFVPAITPDIASVFAQAQRGIQSKGITGAIIIFNHAGTKTESIPCEETAFEMRDKKYWLLSQTTWKVTGNKQVDEQARNKVVEFNRWFRTELIKAGGTKTIHAITNQEDDFNVENDFGLYIRHVNKQRILQTQQELDPNGVFRMNQTVVG